MTHITDRIGNSLKNISTTTTSMPTFFLAFFCIFLLLLLVACDRGEEVKAVDFSKTVPLPSPEATPPDRPVLRGAVGAMISPKETHEIYLQLLAYISDRMDMELEFIQRQTYAEVNELLGRGDLDLAFICSGPYALGREEFDFELLATPVVQGEHEYRSYLIVHQESPFQSLEDLRGTTFAFTDPQSNTGRLVPEYWLARMGERPETFFRDVIYTYSHDNSIQAVAQGLVDGAAVDNLIWDFFDQKKPVHTSRTRIIKTSDSYGIPPIVVSSSLPPELTDQIRDLLLGMHGDPHGAAILHELMIDRFVRADKAWYASIQDLHDTIDALRINQQP
ncbi:phosphonate transport system substrate-binding protein [Desulfonatronum thiosulfatophilum]|uniref:Phosphonate transport system substrate-binding protein n=1 Tax=Desulfonatronum thiosulfatophilum TaxID=617002 RepID=A0A1G6BI60_9BACT|nr:phosphate/phosphite/phosphonate ABC transporter substrate-binding protein [Desulfonatronum thiosulfatophilum]SDB20284.1 phosphonate transport system substrate-binding protein [Desulfonatronum thiosulfatophilum]